jgi:hypothetical protein
MMRRPEDSRPTQASIMDDPQTLLAALRRQFPAIAGKVDARHRYRWGDQETSAAMWLESLANVLNDEMRRGIPPEQHAPLFGLINGALDPASGKVRRCIDVGFVEGLFWQVAGEWAKPYWRTLPAPLREMYLAFHGKPPA